MPKTDDLDLDALEAVADGALTGLYDDSDFIATFDPPTVKELIARVRALEEEIGHYQGLAEKLGEPDWALLSGLDQPELGPGWHVMEAECNVYSVTQGSYDAPCDDDHKELAETLRLLLDGLTSRRFDGKPGAYR